MRMAAIFWWLTMYQALFSPLTQIYVTQTTQGLKAHDSIWLSLLKKSHKSPNREKQTMCLDCGSEVTPASSCSHLWKVTGPSSVLRKARSLRKKASNSLPVAVSHPANLGFVFNGFQWLWPAYTRIRMEKALHPPLTPKSLFSSGVKICREISPHNPSHSLAHVPNHHVHLFNVVGLLKDNLFLSHWTAHAQRAGPLPLLHHVSQMPKSLWSYWHSQSIFTCCIAVQAGRELFLDHLWREGGVIT